MSLFCITFNSLGQLDGLQVGQYKKDIYKEKRIERQPKVYMFVVNINILRQKLGFQFGYLIKHAIGITLVSHLTDNQQNHLVIIITCIWTKTLPPTIIIDSIHKKKQQWCYFNVFRMTPHFPDSIQKTCLRLL